MDIFSCESEMIAANYSDENTHRWSRVLLLSGSMWGHQILITTDLNLVSQIQISICFFKIFLCFQAYYVVWYLKASISFKLIFSWFTIACKCLSGHLYSKILICSLATGLPSPKTPNWIKWNKVKSNDGEKFSTKDKMDKNSTASIIDVL